VQDTHRRTELHAEVSKSLNTPIVSGYGGVFQTLIEMVYYKRPKERAL
jgi:hypothetical protein